VHVLIERTWGRVTLTAEKPKDGQRVGRNPPKSTCKGPEFDSTARKKRQAGTAWDRRSMQGGNVPIESYLENLREDTPVGIALSTKTSFSATQT